MKNRPLPESAENLWRMRELNDRLLFICAWLSCQPALDDSLRSALAAVFFRPDEIPLDTDAEGCISICREAIGKRLERPSPSGRPANNLVQKAGRLAEDWRRAGVRIYPAGKFVDPVFVPEAKPQLIMIQGSEEILSGRKAAVLNSRKTRRIHPSDSWLRASRICVETALKNGRTLVAGLGERHYELVCRLVCESGGPLALVLDHHLPAMMLPRERGRFHSRYEGLLPLHQTAFVSFFSPGRLPPRNRRRIIRDEGVAALADELLVAAVNIGGNMARLAGAALAGKKSLKVFPPKAEDDSMKGNRNLIHRGAGVLKCTFTPESLAEAPVRPEDGGPATAPLELIGRPGGHLVHLTRACPGPWPAQKLSEYYQALVAGQPDSGHTGFDTLRRILGERKIRGGRRLTRGPEPAVSFSARGLEDLKHLIGWRRSLARWSMEPYGLLLPRKELFRQGARPVIYGDEGVWQRLPARQKYRFQLHRPPKTDWSAEKEWRLSGDLDLNRIPFEKVVAIVAAEEEARRIHREFGLAVMLFPG